MRIVEKITRTDLVIFSALLAVVVVFAWFMMWTLELQGTYHTATDLADLDGDSDLDVILHHVRQEAEFTAFGGATLWINRGDGQFVARDPEDAGGWASAAGDADGDGDVDLLVYSGWQLRLLLNRGGAQGGQSGEFGNDDAIAAVGVAQYGSLISGDLNGDGRVDGVVVGCCGRLFTVDADDDTPNVSWVWINEWEPGSRMLSRVFVLSALDGLAMRAAALDDLDGDGDLDLFAAVIAPPEGRNRDPADRVLFNDGDGNFSDSGQRLGDSDSSAVALGDLDGDGDVDALVGSGTRATLWINQGGRHGGREGAFVRAGELIGRDQTRAVFLADLDGDGDLDAFLAGRKQGVVWWNDGQAVFTRVGQHFRYSHRHGVAIGDFNGDDRPDIFAADYSRRYRVWLNQGNGTFRSRLWP